MMRTSACLFALFVLTLGCGAPAENAEAPAAPAAPPSPLRAEAVLEPRSDSGVTGKAEFALEGSTVTLSVSVAGLTPGEHAIHLHEFGDCSAPDGSSAGGHWNPTSSEHGKWGHDPYHHGDIGNLVADAAGNASLTFSTDVWSLGGAPESDVLGKSVIVHAAADDFATQPTGNAGGRVACGVVRVVE